MQLVCLIVVELKFFHSTQCFGQNSFSNSAIK